MYETKSRMHRESIKLEEEMSSFLTTNCPEFPIGIPPLWNQIQTVKPTGSLYANYINSILKGGGGTGIQKKQKGVESMLEEIFSWDSVKVSNVVFQELLFSQFYVPKCSFMHFTYSCLFLISFGFQVYCWGWGGQGGTGPTGALNEGLEWGGDETCLVLCGSRVWSQVITET